MTTMPSVEIRLEEIRHYGLDLDQYFGLWAVEDARFQMMLQHVADIDLAAHCRASAGEPQAAARQKQITVESGSIALIEIRGTMTKRGSSFSDAGSTVRIRQAVRAAAVDPDIGGILLRIDSPGGTVAGTADLAREVHQAAQQKPVYAFADDLTASAAYWVASQAEKIYANQRTAFVGSIGTYFALYDYSGQAEQKGIRAVMMKAGKFKGAGFPGTEITAEQQEHWQELVEKVQSEFSAAIVAGRKLSAARVAELADGRVHTAADAQALGLIDGIQSLETTIAELQSRIGDNRKRSPSSHSGAKPMSDTTTEKQAATLEDLEICCSGADNEFLIAQLKKKATLDQAQTAWMEEQQQRLDAKQAEVDKLKAEKKKKPGVEPLSDGSGNGNGGRKITSDDGDPVAAFNAAVVEKVKGGMPRRRAVQAVSRDDRDLHQAYLAATNPGRRKIQDLIEDRFAMES